jgi:Nif-specific regulatory protein
MTMDSSRSSWQSSHEDRHERELDALYSIARILSTRAGQRVMLLEILDELERELGMVRGTIMLLSPDGTELVVEAARSHQSDPQHEARYRRGEGVTGRVLQTGESAIIPRISKEPEFRDRIHARHRAEDGEMSFICVPVTLGSEVVGTLAVDLAFEESAVLAEDERVLAIVSSMIANDVKARRTAAVQREALEAENLRLRDALGERFRPDNIVGNSKRMREVYMRIHQVAASDTTVLLRGESGTGKELVASAIHYSSPRAMKPFVKVNCAALSEGLLESELFGHEKGAFTGAVSARIGRIEEADGGTLFLDEIGDFSPAVQVKLLRVLQEKEYQRVGSNKTLKADIRLICATNKDLELAIREGTFRNDLYYRINIFPLHLPPLRERKDDILLLANQFANKFAHKMGKTIRRISTSAINMMMAYHWPGNVRELENCVEHAVLLSNDDVIHGRNLPPTLQTPVISDAPPPGSLQSRVSALEKDMIIDALKRSGGNASAAARELGITSRMVRYKIKKLGVDYQRLFKKK